MYCAGGNVACCVELFEELTEELVMEEEEEEEATVVVAEVVKMVGKGAGADAMTSSVGGKGGITLVDVDELEAGQTPKHRIRAGGTSLSKSPPTYLMSYVPFS